MAFKAFLVLAFFLIGRPQDLIPALQPFRPVLVLTFLTALIAFLNYGTGRVTSLFRLKEARIYNLFYLVMILGIPFAYHRRVAFDTVFFSYLSNMIFFYLLLLLVNSTARLKALFMVLLLSAFSYSVFGLALGSFDYGRFFIYGSMYDPNDIAYVLISIFPVCFFFIFRKSGAVKKSISLTTMAASIALILLTGSRAGILGVGLVFILLLFSRRGTVKASHKALVIAAVVLVAFFYSDKINVERYLTLTDISQDYNVTDEFGRMQIWKRGYELLLSNPVTGVGVNCFPMALGILRDDKGLIPHWQATHNSYVQVLTETGLAGFTLFLMLIYGTYRTLARFKNLKDNEEEDDELHAMARCLEIGFTGHIFTAFFLTQGYSVLFPLFFAFSTVMRNIRITQPVRIDRAMERRAELAARSDFLKT